MIENEVDRMIAFREASAEDAGLISYIYASSWRKGYRDFIPKDYLDRLQDEYWVASIRTWLSEGRFEGLLLYEDKKPVGAAVFGRGRDEDHSTWGEIVSIYLLPDSFGKGLGGQLLEKILSVLRGQGYERFYLWMIDGNTAADHFYRKHGFKPTADHIAYSIGGAPIRDVRYVLVEDKHA